MTIITLLSDFGTADGYVGVMYGVILRINPRAVVVDLCHDVAPQDIQGAAFILSTAYPYFPADAIHIAIVDPGVGTERRAVAVRTTRGTFVAPDNGILSYVLAREAVADMVHLTNARYWLSPLSATFHGRDVFAPVAAHLSLGASLGDMGTALNDPVRLVFHQAVVRADGSVLGEVLHVDRFGNLITNIGRELLPVGRALRLCIADREAKGPCRTYALANDGELLALLGSSGYLEIAQRNGSAAGVLGVGRGAQVTLAAVIDGLEESH